MMALSIIFFLLINYCCLEKRNLNNTKQNKIMEMRGNLDLEHQNNIIINNDYLNREKDLNSYKKIKEDTKNVDSYTICNFCGFFYYSETTDKKGKRSCCVKFWSAIKDFCLLNLKSFIDCFNVTFCYAINQIFCGRKERCKCCCNCFEENSYAKISENFCFCYKQKRKYKWFHDYLTSDVQKDIIPYILEYFLF